ncbi:MAG: DNA primase [Eggerthellaceae bacterium]|jgi:DNA primase
MAGFSPEDIQRVREANDLVDVFSERVPLKQRGRDYWCCCPFHQEKTPSCKVDPSTQLWHCFGCGEGGDVYKFIEKIDDLEFPDAVRYLARRGNVEIAETRGGMPQGRKARLREVCRETAEFYHKQLMRGKGDGPDRARAYLAGRGLGGSTPNDWMLGYAPGSGALVRHLRSKGFKADEMIQANVAVEARNGSGPRDRFFERVMFPICDSRGEYIAFGGRVIGDGEPKYLNSRETPLFHKSEVLYGMDKAKAAMTATGTAVICEGYTDVIFLHKAGVSNAVATLGTALTMQHIRQISRHASKRIVYLFDGDEAGQRAANRALEFIDESMTPEAGKTRIELFAVVLPDNLDPADFVLQRGADALQEQLDHAQPLLQFGIDRRLAQYDLDTPESRTRAMADALSVLAPIKDSVLAKDYALQIAGRTRSRESDVLEKLAQLKKPRRFDADSQRRAEGGRRGASAAAPAQRPASETPQRFRLSPAEANRRRSESEFVGLCASYTPLALQYAQQLSQTNWHDSNNGRAAELVLDVLSKNPQATPAQIISEASRVMPQAANLLTSVQSTDMPREELARFLSEELAIGDQEDAIASLKQQLSDPNLPKEEGDLLNQAVIAMQAELRQMRANHTPK